MDKIKDIKKPQLNYSIHTLIADRWSTRAYDPKPVEKEKLQRVFEAGSWAPSAYNMQPWYYLIGFKGDEVFQKIFDTLVEFNQLWVVNAPVLVLAIANTKNQKGEPNPTCLYDLGQSVANISIQATYENLYVHQMTGFDIPSAEKSLEIPQNFNIITAFTIGYRGDENILVPNLQKLELMPRSRKNMSEFVFTEKFGKKASFLE